MVWPIMAGAQLCGAMLEVAYRLSQPMVARLCLDVRADHPVGCSRAAIVKAAKKRWAKVRKRAKKVA
jgi:hypothetical protein